jgi:hypothetical protein
MCTYIISSLNLYQNADQRKTTLTKKIKKIEIIFVQSVGA